MFCGIDAARSLRLVPKVIVDDLQFRDMLDNPFAFRVGARLPLAGFRVLDKALAVI